MISNRKYTPKYRCNSCTKELGNKFKIFENYHKKAKLLQAML